MRRGGDGWYCDGARLPLRAIRLPDEIVVFGRGGGSFALDDPLGRGLLPLQHDAVDEFGQPAPHLEGLLQDVAPRRKLFRMDTCESGEVDEDDITQMLSEQYGVPSINLRHFEIDESVINLIPSEVSQKYLVVPVNRTGATLTIGMADPTNVFAMDDIKFMTGYNVEPV